jgi:hypothetical protein
MKKKICILYPYSWLAFAPATLNLHDALAEKYDASIILTHADPVSKKDVEKNRSILQLDYTTGLSTELGFLAQKLLYRLGLTKNNAQSYGDYLERRALRRILQQQRPEQIVVADLDLLTIVQKFFQGPIHLLELELGNFKKLPDIKLDLITSLITESEPRKKIMFSDNANIKTFYIPLSNVFKAIEKPVTTPGDYLYCGSAIPPFGIFSCINLLKMDSNFQLTVKGRIPSRIEAESIMNYSDFLDDNRLHLDYSYTLADELQKELAKFRIGFCFYDTRFQAMRNPHIEHVSSQKVYLYYGSGVPVIANRLAGLQHIEDFGCGILLDDMRLDSIYEATQIIENNYDYYVQNCFAAAEYFSYDKHVKPFIEFVETTN